MLAGLVQAGERHAGNEATPQVGSQEVGQGGVGNHDEHHQDEQRLVLDRDLGVSSSRRQSRNDPLVDGLRPELNRQAHCDDHESNADDGVDDSGHDIEVAPQAKQHVEQDQRQDVINEGGCDDSLAEVHLKNTSLTQQTKRNADACRSQGGADRNAVRRHGVSVKEHDQGAAHQRKDCADDSDEAGLRADHFGFVEVEVHSTLEDHEGDTCVADESEDIWVEAALVGDFGLAALVQTLVVAGKLGAVRAARQAPDEGERLGLSFLEHLHPARLLQPAHAAVGVVVASSGDHAVDFIIPTSETSGCGWNPGRGSANLCRSCSSGMDCRGGTRHDLGRRRDSQRGRRGMRCRRRGRPRRGRAYARGGRGVASDSRGSVRIHNGRRGHTVTISGRDRRVAVRLVTSLTDVLQGRRRRDCRVIVRTMATRTASVVSVEVGPVAARLVGDMVEFFSKGLVVGGEL
mmetsp:Transcript_17282/g.37451  ORF Transcript_17282/g.37451 Transcript_17282/m.37451 type:complete len:460 (-) Transcript_17282:391-1770(-)